MSKREDEATGKIRFSDGKLLCETTVKKPDGKIIQSLNFEFSEPQTYQLFLLMQKFYFT